MVKVKDKEEFLAAVKDRLWIRAPFCGDGKVEKEIKEKTGYKTNCIPFDQPNKLGKCAWTGKDAKFEVLFAKSF